MTAYAKIQAVAKELGVPIKPNSPEDIRRLREASCEVDLSVVGWKPTRIDGNACYTFDNPDRPYISAYWGTTGDITDGGKAAILAHELGHHIEFEMGANDPLGSISRHDAHDMPWLREDPYVIERNASWWGYTLLLDALGTVTDEQRAYLNFSIYQRATQAPWGIRSVDGTTDFRDDLL
jgi:hypothetical protein